MNFIFYDIIFLILFCLGVAFFLYKNWKKVEIESKIILLYKTKLGLDRIEKIKKKYSGLLSFLEIFVIILGYIMMAFSIVAFVYMIWNIFSASTLPKIAPIIPLIPYMPELFNLTFLPPFYFTYWIITIAIIAVGHEFSHGIFARLNGIRLKSTGFGFIGPLLAAFVEVDEEQMSQKPIKAQLSVLAAGSAANLVLAFVFLAAMNGFFMAAYAPSGATFNMYGMERVNISAIYGMNGMPVNNFYEDYSNFRQNNVTEFNFTSKNKYYFGNAELIDKELKANVSYMILYSDSPAYNANLSGAIKEIDSGNLVYTIKDKNDLENTLELLKPGENVMIKTTEGNYSMTLGIHPENSSRAYLGIMAVQTRQKVIGKIVSFFSGREPFTYYEPRIKSDGNLTVFIYNLLFWIVFINFSVMFVNMLPFGIFDGGRFFYLTALSVTGSKRKSNRAYRIMTWLMILALILMMVVWYFKAF